MLSEFCPAMVKYFQQSFVGYEFFVVLLCEDELELTSASVNKTFFGHFDPEMILFG